ncbi:hypothetical protein [Paracoccus sp. (in: a-proteobacteria)]|uniref:hypothetical protein n=1 Tax=Paracoccus sp. TaxID=267 RepID=UPI0035B13509
MSLDSAIEYALFFSADAVHLRRRERPAPDGTPSQDGAGQGVAAQAAAGQAVTAQAWRHLGSVDFDTPDFRGDLVRLRLMSGLPEDDGSDDAMLPVTLIIPDDQILYTTLTVPPGADREHAVGRALDGLTPYRIEDLAFDWDGDGDSVRVAAVARQTLREAQEFAAQYGFDGQEFRAAPEAGGYPGEPVFLLDPVQPARAARGPVDLAQVSVISPDLLIEADEEHLDDGQGHLDLDLDLGGDMHDVPAPQPALADGPVDVPVAAPQADADPAETGEAVAAVPADDADRGAPPPESASLAKPEDTRPLPEAGASDDDDDEVTPLAALLAEPVKAEEVAQAEDAPAEDAPAPADDEPKAAMGVEEATAPEAGSDTRPETVIDAPAPIAAENAAPGSDHAAAGADTGAAIAAAASIAAETSAPSTAPAGAKAAPPVVRHAPARPAGTPPAAEKVRSAPEINRSALNPRARAVHDRAAEARNARPAGAAPAAAPRPGQRGGLLGLIAMLGALVVGLVLIWAFVVPTPQPAPPEEGAAPAPQIAAAGDPVTEGGPDAPAATAPAEAPATPAGETAPPVQVAATPEAGAVETVPAETVPVETRPQPQVAAPVDVPAASQPTQSTAEPAAGIAGRSISALTEEERRRVIVAAAAVAAAVVPPAQAAIPDLANDPAEGGAVPGAQPQEAATRPSISAVAPAQRPNREAQQQQAVERALRAAIEGGVVSAPAAANVATASVSPRAATPAARLTSSARPQLAPRRSTPRTSAPQADTVPAVPANPLPFDATQRRVQPAASARPPARAGRPASPAPTPAVAPARSSASQPAAQAQPEPQRATTASNSRLRGSARPPLRPEGSAPDLIDPEPGRNDGAALTPAEARHLRDLIHDLGRIDLPAASVARPRDAADFGTLLAQARPARKPGGAQPRASDAVSPSAIDAALRSASTSPPDKPAGSAGSVAPARDSGGLLRGSDRPRARPGSRPAGAAVAGLSDKAVEAAISAAVEASPATPGGVRLSALNSSPLPPRRSDAAPAERPADTPADTPGDAPAAAESTAPAANDPSEADLAARRKLDEQLQAQAEARVRARAQADARAEAQARAQAEARARAQAEAEERAARAKRQEYKPPEVDDEPEIAAAALSKGTTTASVAKAATERRGIDMGRTTIIGIIGAGQASRALIRLRNGKIVTVRLGDRIDGGQINSIGNGRLTYVKGGRTHELRLLDGR